MMSNDPKRTLPMGSHAKVDSRRVQPERRQDDRRATLGDRRTAGKRVLRALLRI